MKMLVKKKELKEKIRNKDKGRRKLFGGGDWAYSLTLSFLAAKMKRTHDKLHNSYFQKEETYQFLLGD